jgi:hypothetical protein
MNQIEKNLYPHEKLLNFTTDIISEECPINFSIVMICYGLTAFLFEMIIPYFFSMWVIISKSEWPVLNPIVIFGWSVCGYLTTFLIIIGWVECLCSVIKLTD